MSAAKQITDSSYFLKNNDEMTIGLLVKQENGYLFINQSEKTEFKTLEEVENRFGKITYDKTAYENTKHNELNGYPTRHGTVDAFPIDGLDSYPTYKTGGNAVFAAGYWALQMKVGQRFGVTWSPKLNTLSEATHYGPFKSRIEALQESNIQNQRLEKEYLEKNNG